MKDCSKTFFEDAAGMAASGHPAPWAIFEADEKLLKETAESESMTEAFETRLLSAIESDEGREADSILRLYESSPKEYRMIIDAVLVHLCGWSLPTLLKKED